MAAASFRKELEVRPGDSYAIENLPLPLLHAGRWAEAQVAAALAVQTRPKNILQKVRLAVARACQGKITGTPQEIDAALGVNPSGSLLNDAAYFLAECDKTELAEPYIGRALDQLASSETSTRTATMSSAIAIQNSRGHYLDTYGWLLFKRNENERALNLLNAAASLTPGGEVFAHLAQAESKAGHGDKAVLYWREATFLQPGQLSRVPPDVAPKLESIAQLSLDRIWYPLGADMPGNFAAVLPEGQPSYFFLSANADGSVQSVRELDSEDQAAKQMLPAFRALKFPVIQVDASPVASAYLVKLVRGSDGKVVPSRSVSTEAVAIATDLLPGEFPLPDSATPAVSTAQTPAGAYRIGGGISPPTVLYKVEPEYSEEARQAHLEGAALLFIVVDSDGMPRDMRVLRSLGLGLDEKAVAAVSQWQFQPGLKSGEPVNVQAQVQVYFRLLENSPTAQWRLKRVEYRLPDGVLRPIIDKVADPHMANDAPAATATLVFEVDEKGVPVNLRVDKSSDEEWARDVTDALMKWKFTPASQNGAPVSVPCSMDFARGN